MNRPVGSPLERFWQWVNTDGPIPAHRSELGQCWIWQGAPTTRGGYGMIVINRRSVRAHRFAYETFVRPVPDGLEIDHLCRVHLCVNPAHLEAVTHQENVRRGRGPDVAAARWRAKTHCPQGHPYDEANTGRRENSHRYCRACARDRMRRLKRNRRRAA